MSGLSDRTPAPVIQFSTEHLGAGVDFPHRHCFLTATRQQDCLGIPHEPPEELSRLWWIIKHCIQLLCVGGA